MSQSKQFGLASASLLVAVFASFAGAQMPDPDGPPELRNVRTSPPNPAARAIAEKGGTGAFPAEMIAETALPTHTIYRPRDLNAPGGRRLPIVAWGNGACVNIGNRFRYFLTELASHGYLVIAVGPIRSDNYEGGPQEGPPPVPGTPEPAPTPPPQTVRPEELIPAIDWAAKENSRAGSPYYGRLDITKVATMGQSCGGEQAIVAGADPRVSTVGVFNSGSRPGWPERERVRKMHGTALYIGGDSADGSFPNANDDFDKLRIPVFRAWQEGVRHSGTYGQPSGGSFAKVAVAWLDWQLKGDQQAGKMFKGKDCELCNAPGWHVLKKKID